MPTSRTAYADHWLKTHPPAPEPATDSFSLAGLLTQGDPQRGRAATPQEQRVIARLAEWAGRSWAGQRDD